MSLSPSPKLSTSDKMQSFLLQNRHGRLEEAGPVCENNAGGALYIRNEEVEEALGGKHLSEQIFPAHCTALHCRLFPIVNHSILSIGKLENRRKRFDIIINISYPNLFNPFSQSKSLVHLLTRLQRN